MIVSHTLILPVMQLQTRQMMKSQIRSHSEYLFNTDLYFCAHFVVKIDKKSSLNDVF